MKSTDSRAIVLADTPELSARRVGLFSNQKSVVGHFCLLDIDECASTPCQNNGTCVDGFDGYTCLCMAGYTGDVCETSELASYNVQ